MNSEQVPTDEKPSLEEAAEIAQTRALIKLENRSRETNWGGVDEPPYKKEYMRDGVVPHELFAQEMAGLGITNNERPIVESNEWGPERLKLASQAYNLILKYKAKIQETLENTNTSKERIGEESALRTRQFTTQLMDECNYAALTSFLPDEVYEQLPRFEQGSVENSAGMQILTEARPVDIENSQYIAENGIVVLQNGGYYATSGELGKGIVRPARMIKGDPNVPGEIMPGNVSAFLFTDELIFLSNKYGDVVTPETFHEDPQTIQVNEEKSETTLRSDRTRLAIVRHKGTIQTWDGRDKTTTINKLVAVASPDMSEEINIRSSKYFIERMQKILNGQPEDLINPYSGDAESTMDRMRKEVQSLDKATPSE